MRRLTHENWLVLVLTAAIAAVAVGVVYVPQERKLESIKTQIATLKLSLEDGMTKAAVVPQMARNVQNLKGRYKDFDRRLPKSKELGGFLQEITSIQEGSALADARMDTGNPISEELFNTMPIKMHFRGRYLAVADFLRRLTNMQRLTRVQQLLITSPSEEGEDLDIEVLVNIYFTKT
jgi:Tfp pilus assembly protein PilO